ncbi:MAG: serine--glyoxylate aminotransferase [Magnetovibrio sp.]|nr:serine--glyoxylate aminotransferase [Magnetovibrio sp.]
MGFRSGRHFLQIPGPTNVPDRILRSMDIPTIDHRGPEFRNLGQECLNGIKKIFKTENPVIIYPASGTGAWEAALVNTLNPGDKVLMFETGHFATLWNDLAKSLDLNPQLLESDWRSGADAAIIEERLRADSAHEIKSVCVVHNETSTGATTNITNIRTAMDAAKHPALLIVDTISSLASIEYCHDEWGVDVTVSGSQKGLMLPPGLSFNAISKKALGAHSKAKLRRSYWDWSSMIESNKSGYFPYTPATNLLYGLREALKMLFEEGLENVFARHDRHAEATRRAIQAWGLDILCKNPKEFSSTLTAVMMPEGHDADHVRGVILDKFDMSLGTGLGKVKGKAFRIGHLGNLNDLTLLGTLAGVEMGLGLSNVPHQIGGVQQAITFLLGTNQGDSN